MSNLLREALATASRTGLGIYALVDPSLLDESSRRLVASPSRSAGLTIVSIVPGGIGLNDGNALNVLPYLVNLVEPTLKESLLQRTVDWALESQAVTWIAAAVEQTSLAVSLASRMDIQLSQQQLALLRFSDARVLPSVYRVLEDDQRPAFFSPVRQWWYFDREEALRQLPISPIPQAVEWPAPWRLTDTQESALLEAAEPDAVLAILRRLAPLDIESLPRNARHAFVLHQIASAKRWGIDAENQQALFCLAALEFGEGFEEKNAWPDALAKVKSGALDMSEAIASAQSKDAAT